MKLLKWAVVIVVALFCAGFALVTGSSHGHMNELLVVTVKVVDRDTGRPLDRAVLATLRHRDMLDWQHIDETLVASAHDAGSEDARRFGRVQTAWSSAEGTTTIRSAAYVTRCWWGPFETSKTMYGPAVLLVDHAKHGRTIITLDPKAPIPGEEPRTWRLDLGTVLIPQE